MAPTDASDWLLLFNPLSPQGGNAPTLEASPSLRPPLEVADLVERWVRRIALGGDQRRGVARVDLGGGVHDGGELVVVAEAGRVSVELTLPRSPDAGLAERLRRRLEQRGLHADVTVR